MTLRRKLKYSGSVAMMTFSVLLGGCSTPGSSFFKSPTEKSIISLAMGEYEDAANYSETALKKDPSDPYALMVAGISYENLGFSNKSRRFYEDLVSSETDDFSVMGDIKNLPPESLRKTAATRLLRMEQKKRPFAEVKPEDGMAEFTDEAYRQKMTVIVGDQVSPQGQTSITVKYGSMKGGLAMLSEGDRNVVQRFLTFKQLLDEQLVTTQEFEERRSANLGGLMPYTLAPAGLGMNLPSPPAESIISRLNALKDAVEMRAITPSEHAAEREIILDALLPANPRRRMDPLPPPQGMLEGGTALRRIEMLKNINLITPREAEEEKKAIERLVYMRLGMSDANKGIDSKELSACITKCARSPQVVCPPAAKPAVKKAVTPAKKAPVKKAAAPVKKQTDCVCPVP